jgi:hypothetical protein
MLVSKALATKIGAGVAAAGIAVGGGAAVANASSTHAHKGRIPTTLAITAGPGHVVKHKYPHTVAWIKGHLTTATKPSFDVPGVKVWLERDVKGTWTVVNHARTNRRGWVTFRVHGLRNGASFKLVFFGNKFLKPAASDIVTIAPVK